MLRTRTATKADIKRVMKSLSDISSEELRHAGYLDETGHIDLNQPTTMMINAARTDDAVTILNRAEPIAILILQPESSTVHTTMFMATEGFFGEGNWAPTRFLRRYLDVKMKRKPGVTLRSMTFSRHPQLLKWYRLMGYGAPEPRPDGNGNTFTRSPAERRVEPA